MIQTKLETTAQQVHVKDELETARRASRVVSKVDRKTKWVYLTFEDGSKTELRLTDPVTVVRWEKTEEERQAELLDFVLRQLRSKLSDGLADRAVGLVRSALERHEEKGYDIFTWSNLPDMLLAEAETRLFRQIEHTRATLVENGVAEDDALIAAFSDLDRYAQRSRMQNPLSRSTSTLSNLLEDLDTYAISELQGDLRWVLSSEVSKPVVDRVLDHMKARREAEVAAS